jgi:hypothetical protein
MEELNKDSSQKNDNGGSQHNATGASQSSSSPHLDPQLFQISQTLFSRDNDGPQHDATRASQPSSLPHLDPQLSQTSQTSQTLLARSDAGPVRILPATPQILQLSQTSQSFLSRSDAGTVRVLLAMLEEPDEELATLLRFCADHQIEIEGLRSKTKTDENDAWVLARSAFQRAEQFRELGRAWEAILEDNAQTAAFVKEEQARRAR